MAKPEPLTTILSTKGQLILPQGVRRARNWGPGTRLMVEDTPEGVLLRPVSVFAPTHPDDVFGSLAYAGPPKSVEEMDAGVAAEARRRHARD
ncbi:MAG TPA: AbrB/MazE/SpoVT family DNA-binding domain-containing protein [Caulobacter sp.]|nr:AbrB/MazE/SpoVT family DNA-binding domain-containing protein [Caulobacter sp.]